MLHGENLPPLTTGAGPDLSGAVDGVEFGSGTLVRAADEWSGLDVANVMQILDEFVTAGVLIR